MKRCSKCQQEKPLDEFHWDSHQPDAHREICADCKNPGRTPGPVNRRRNPSEMAAELASGVRICRVCQVPKALDGDFYRSVLKNGAVQYSTDCKECRRLEYPEKAPVIRVLHTKYHQENREGLLFRKRLTNRSRLWNYKLQVFRHYGLMCACCGEKEIHFLQIDHISGGGNRHRASLEKHAGWHFYAWLVKQGFPPGYRTLCANCNSALGYYGFCPHDGKGKQIRLL
jgi:hypothetical protein